MALSFSASVLQNIQRIQREVNDRCYTISIELFLRVVSLTPAVVGGGRDSKSNNTSQYATGLLVNQWYPTVGGGWSSEMSGATDDTGSGSISRIRALNGGRQFLEQDGRLALTNNVDHGYRAEMLGWPNKDEGGRWSGKIGPYRMVALSLQQIAAKYK